MLVSVGELDQTMSFTAQRLEATDPAEFRRGTIEAIALLGSGEVLHLIAHHENGLFGDHTVTQLADTLRAVLPDHVQRIELLGCETGEYARRLRDALRLLVPFDAPLMDLPWADAPGDLLPDLPLPDVPAPMALRVFPSVEVTGVDECLLVTADGAAYGVRADVYERAQFAIQMMTRRDDYEEYFRDLGQKYPGGIRRLEPSLSSRDGVKERQDAAAAELYREIAGLERRVLDGRWQLWATEVSKKISALASDAGLSSPPPYSETLVSGLRTTYVNLVNAIDAKEIESPFGDAKRAIMAAGRVLPDSVAKMFTALFDIGLADDEQLFGPPSNAAQHMVQLTARAQVEHFRDTLAAAGFPPPRPAILESWPS